MRTRLFLVGGLALPVAAFVATATHLAAQGRGTAPAKAQATALIAGRVIDAESKQPLDDAIVTLGGAVADRSVMVDERGRFVFQALAPGRYSIAVERFGYLSGAHGRLSPSDLSQHIEVRASERVMNADVMMWRGASIEGRVVDHFGEPMPKASVWLLPRGLRGLRSATRAAGTDDRGTYRFAGLQPGDYAVAVPARVSTFPASVLREALSSKIALGVAEIAVMGDQRYQQVGDFILANMSVAPVPPAPGAGGRVSVFRTTFSPTATSPGAATIVTLRAGESRRGIDVTMTPASGVRVSGVLADSSGPVPLTPIRLVRAEGSGVFENPGFETVTGISDRAGRFTLLGVPPGRYEVRARMPRQSPPGLPANLEPASYASEAVTVGSVDVDGVVVSARPIAIVRGRLDPAPAAGAEIVLQSYDSSPDRVQNPRVDKSGAFAAQLLPGRYIFAAFSEKGRCASVLINGRDIGDALVEIGWEDLEVTFTCGVGLGRFVGTIRDASGAPNPAGLAVVFSADSRHWSGADERPARVTSARANATGAFTIANLPAGEYYVAAIHAGVSSRWRETAALQSLAQSALRIRIANEETRTVDVPTAVLR